jgi:sugar phosphate isomerase/epimerase
MKKQILLISVTIFCSEFIQAQKPVYTAPLGVQTYTFRRSIGTDPAKVLDTIKALGFKEIEGGGGRMHPADFKKLCDERGISIPSTGAGYEDLVNKIDSVVWRAKTLGAKYVMCAWIPHQDNVLTFENAKKAVEDFNKPGKF